MIPRTPDTLTLPARIYRRFAQRPDREHEQAIIRLVIGVLLGIYLVPYAIGLLQGTGETTFPVAMATFIVASVGILAHIYWRPDICVPRRLLGTAIDIGAVTYFMMTANDYAAPFYAVYLWIIFGNGIRYGKPYLFYALVLSLAGFAAVLLHSTYWQAHLTLGVGLWIGQFVISLYVGALVGRLTIALSRAEAANQAKRRFISTVSHEMRTPLNAIIGMNDLLRDTPLNGEQREMADAMGQASHAMLQLVEDVLDFSKIEAGKLTVEHLDFDLHTLVRDAIRIFARQAAGRGLNLHTQIMPEVPPALRGDPRHLRQVLFNLIGNAIKFTERGEVLLRVSAQMETDQSVWLHFAVRDTGIGIAPESQLKIFESFAQADESTTRRYGGTGLGTAISKQLVELMGGRIGLESVPGEGSVFWFELPFVKQPATVSAERDAQLAGLRALLLGFDEAQRRTLDAMLTNWGVRANHAATPENALARMEEAASLERHYQLITVCGAPQTGDPQHAIDVLRNAGSKLPLLLCLPGASALQPEEREHYLAAGYAAVLDMPVEKRLLFNALHAAMAMVPEAVDGVVSLERYYTQRTQGQRGYTILVAEDNATNRKVIQKILERAGHVVTLVENGDEALDQLEEQDFDLIIVDRNMPFVSGIEVARTYRLMRSGQVRAPIIMLSADATPEAVEESNNAGINAFLSKPVEARRLLDTIADLAGRPEGAEAEPERGTLHQLATSDAHVLNHATLADLAAITPDAQFITGLIDGFMHDSEVLIDRMAESLAQRRYEEFKDEIHAIKGSASSIGAECLAEACNAIGPMTHADIERNAQALLEQISSLYAAARDELLDYRRRHRVAAI
ncbi:MAG TPA: ATP-binding protein [Burkholderiales bacterium]|nr:ATP-binding protein [Burkholderiales bacterium]